MSIDEIRARLEAENARLTDAIARLRMVVDNLRGAMAAQDERERAAGERCGVPYESSGCDWPDAVAEAVLARDRKIAELEREVAEARKAGAVEVLTALLDSAVECGMTFIQLSAVRAVRDRCKRGEVKV